MNVLIDVIDMLKMLFDFVGLSVVVHHNYAVHLMNHVLHHWLIIYYCYFLMINLEEVKQMVGIRFQVLNKKKNDKLIQFFCFIYDILSSIVNEVIDKTFTLFFLFFRTIEIDCID
jgi:hypothetical protein